jgi:ABC-2 type transport system permease protein
VLQLGYSRVRAATATVNVLLGAVVCVVVVAQVTGLRLQEGLSGLVSSSSNPSGKVAFLPPWAWFGQSLNALAHGDYRSFWSATAICTAVTVALGWIAVVLGERVWVAGSLAEGSGAVRYRYREPSSRRGLMATLVPAPLAAVLGKEFRYLWRDPLLVSQAGMPMILFVVPFIMAGNPAMGRAVGQDEMFAFCIFMVLAVLYMQASILSASSIGLEGRAFWAYLISPNNAQTLLLGKWLASWLISGGLACVLIIIAGLAFQAQLTDVVVLCAAAAGSAAGLCGIGVGISAALPRFTFENPAHRVSPLALIFGFGAGVLYSGIGWSTLGATWYATVTWPRYGLLVSCVGVSAFALLTLFAVMVPLGIGIERISNLEWEH